MVGSKPRLMMVIPRESSVALACAASRLWGLLRGMSLEKRPSDSPNCKGPGSPNSVTPRKLPPPPDTRGFENAVVVSDYHDALIPLDISDPREPRVNARDLHAFLEIGKHFGSWITDRIADIELVDNHDFGVNPNSGKNHQGGRPSKEYWLTMDTAKELSMLERNAKGKEARRYFIECEKRLRNLPTVPAIDLVARDLLMAGGS